MPLTLQSRAGDSLEAGFKLFQPFKKFKTFNSFKAISPWAVPIAT